MPEGATVRLLGPRRRARACTPTRPARKLKTIDATCPLVTKVHVEARKFAADGYTIVLIGHEGHEEVEGTMGEAPEHIVLVQTEEDVDALEVADPERVAYITQTTLVRRRDAGDHRRGCASASRRSSGPRTDDICYATTNRQDGGQADRAEHCDLRARDRLAQLLQLQPPGRGRARATARVAPDRQRDARSARSGWRARASSASPPAPARRRSSCRTSSQFFRARGVDGRLRVRGDPRGRPLHAAQDDPRSRTGAPRRTAWSRHAERRGVRATPALAVAAAHQGAPAHAGPLRPAPRRRLALGPAAPRPSCARRCCEAVEGVDRLVLLGDVLELRHGPPREALAAARRSSRISASALAGRRARARRRQPRPRADRAVAGRCAPSFPRRAARARAAARAGRGLADGQAAGRWAPGAVCACLPGAVGAPRRLRDARPLPRLSPHRPHDRAPERRRDEPDLLGRPAQRSTGRRLRGRDRPMYAWRHAVARDARTGNALNGIATVHAWRTLGGAGDSDDAGAMARAGALAAADASPAAAHACDRPRLPAGRRRAQPRRARARCAPRSLGQSCAARGRGRWARSLRRLGLGDAYVVFGHTHRSGPLPPATTPASGPAAAHGATPAPGS